MPQMLQIVVFADVGQEDVDQHVCEVHGYPLGITQSYDMCRLLAQIVAGEVTH